MVGPSTHFFFQGLRIELQLETRYYCAQEGGGGGKKVTVICKVPVPVWGKVYP